jgi:hypothetical protein
LKKRGNPYLNPKDQILSMTRIDLGLMGVYSNYYRHKTYPKNDKMIGLNLKPKA